jgi:hypothetical protein
MWNSAAMVLREQNLRAGYADQLDCCKEGLKGSLEAHRNCGQGMRRSCVARPSYGQE